ncbi:hypothetical protein [Pseudomonas sp. TAE6080]|uniref:hypothetical protein n=1 Tax=Pseudomonas sp. TAE6080 TaxID=2840374 RepID=UPI001C006D4C|nr:hypothetical protein [Pseudomonas sp. TAE6080]MBT9302512.1 hypothetical protein [Pseudomonas sp. TAE6080]
MKIEQRKANKTEMAAYVAQAIEQARVGLPAYEGSLSPTGSTVFYSRSMAGAFERYADLKAQGWTLMHEIQILTTGTFDFVAKKPEAIFQLDIPQISARAEAAYQREIEQHNAAVKRQEQREAEVIAEFERREAARRAQLLEEVRADIERQTNPRFKRANENGFQYR